MKGPDDRRSFGGRYRAVGAAGALIVAGSVPGVVSGGLGVQIRDLLSLDTASFGVVMSASALTVGVAAGGAGVVLDRHGWRRALRWAVAGSAVSLLGIAAAGQVLVAFVAFLIVGACSLAIALPASNVLLADRVPGSRLGLTMGMKQTAASWSALYAGLAVPLIAIPLGWRWVYVVAVAFPIGALLLAPSSEVSAPESTVASSAAGGEAEVWNGRTRFLLIGATGMIASQAVVAFLVISLVDAGIDERTAGIAFALGGIASIFAQVASGWVADRMHQQGLRSVAILLGVATVGLLCLATSSHGLALVGGVVSFGAARGWQGQYFYAVVRSSRHRPGSASGVAVMAMAIGAGLGPASFGLLSDSFGQLIGWSAIAALTAVGAVAAWSGRVLGSDGERSPQ